MFSFIISSYIYCICNCFILSKKIQSSEFLHCHVLFYIPTHIVPWSFCFNVEWLRLTLIYPKDLLFEKWRVLKVVWENISEIDYKHTRSTWTIWFCWCLIAKKSDAHVSKESTRFSRSILCNMISQHANLLVWPRYDGRLFT